MLLMLIVPYPSARLLVEMLLDILVNLSSVVGLLVITSATETRTVLLF